MNFVSIRKKLMFMMGTICALFGIALAFILFLLLTNLVKLKHYKRNFSTGNRIERTWRRLSSTAICFKGLFTTTRQVELDKFNQMSKRLEDSKDKLLSNPNLSSSVKAQWN